MPSSEPGRLRIDPLAVLLAATRALGEGEPGCSVDELRRVLALHGIASIEEAPEPLAGALASLLAVAEQRALEREELLRARERAQMLSEASFEGIMVHVDGSIIDANQPLCDLLGYERDEVLGPDTLRRCIAPEDLPMVVQRMRDRIEGPYVVTGVRKDGSTFRSEILTKQGKLGARPVRIAAVRDVTERERTSAMLRESEARLGELAHAAFDMLAYSRNGVIVRYLGEVEAILGYQNEELVGRRILDLVAPAAQDLTRSQLERTPTRAYVSEMVAKNGTIVPVEVVAIETTLHGEPVRLAGLRDLREARRAEGERREFEQHLQQTQRLESLGVLAGGIAHDFNNLLVGILGGAELLGLADLAPPDRESVRAIMEAGQRAAALTTQLLAYAGRSDLGQSEPIDVSALVTDLRRLLASTLAKKARLEVQIERGSTVLGNRATVLQVLMNLLTNASDALAGEPGTIAVRARRVAEPDPRFKRAHGAPALERDGGWILIEVADSGVGMEETTRLRIFEPFFSTKAKGHGLGLAACLGIVTAHGGAIHVESTPGKGSTFSVLLPAADPGRAEAEGRQSSPGPARVLVVDDEQIVRTQVRRMVEAHGYSVIEAPDGRTALALLDSQAVDLVLLDVTMPEMDGIEVVREARARGHRVPIVLISGYSDFPIETRLEPENYSGFLAKPFKLDDLIAAIRRAMSPRERA